VKAPYITWGTMSTASRLTCDADTTLHSVLQCVAVYSSCSVLQCVAVYSSCSVLQRVAVCCMHVRGARNMSGSFLTTLRSTDWGTRIGTSKNLNSRQLNGANGSNLVICVSSLSTTSRSKNWGTRIGTKFEEQPESQTTKWCWI